MMTMMKLMLNDDDDYDNYDGDKVSTALGCEIPLLHAIPFFRENVYFPLIVPCIYICIILCVLPVWIIKVGLYRIRDGL